MILKASVTTEKRLVIEVRAASETNQKDEIRDVGLIRFPHNFAEGLTKLV